MYSDRLISSDNHVFEPPDLWTDRVERKYRDRAPHLVREEIGDRFYCDGEKLVAIGGGTQPGRRFEDTNKMTMEDVWENVVPGAYIPAEQIKDMDLEGVEANVLYPTIGLILFRVPDADLLAALFRTYNDWIAEFCSSYPSRLKGVGMLNVDDVQASVREVERCAKLGLVSVMIPVSPPDGTAYDAVEYDPLWAAAQDLQMPISLHVATNRTGQRGDGANTKASLACNGDMWVRIALADMIYGGVFERYPRLQVGSIEHELSWAPFFLSRLDYLYIEKAYRPGWHRFKDGTVPSDFFHRNVFLSFQEDALGIQLRHLMGVDNLLWGSDYPHQESTFPKSRETLERILADCTEEEKAKIAGGNCARVFNI